MNLKLSNAVWRVGSGLNGLNGLNGWGLVVLVLLSLFVNGCADVRAPMTSQKLEKMEKQLDAMDEKITQLVAAQGERVEWQVKIEKLVTKLDEQLNSDEPEFTRKQLLMDWQKQVESDQANRFLDQAKKLGEMDQSLQDLTQNQKKLMAKQAGSQKSGNNNGEEGGKALSQLVDALFKRMQRLESRLKTLEAK